jgi:hypothetical protein
MFKSLGSDDESIASNISIETDGSEDESGPMSTPSRSIKKNSSGSKLRKLKTEDAADVKSSISKYQNGVSSPGSLRKKVSKPMKSKSVGSLDIPPAFRYK